MGNEGVAALIAGSIFGVSVLQPTVHDVAAVDLGVARSGAAEGLDALPYRAIVGELVVESDERGDRKRDQQQGRRGRPRFGRRAKQQRDP